MSDLTRRGFVARSLSAAFALALPPAVHRRRPARYDIILRGGTIHDGSGGPGWAGDVAIAGDRIAAIAESVDEPGTLELDVCGLAVAPGFVDIHSHADGTLPDDPRAESVIRQGITTVIVGQDGGSRAPRLPRRGDRGRARSVAALLERWASLRPSVNIATMVGLGTVRAEVVGESDRAATRDELARMTALVEQALADGACGASSGLEYTPGVFATRDELIALCRPLAARRLPYASHLRNEDDFLLEAIEDAIDVARGARVPLQISHLKAQGPRNWAKAADALAMIDRAHAGGLDIAFDRYPYVAYQTGLTNLFPSWSREGGTDAFLARLADGDAETRIRQAVEEKVESIGGWENVMISAVGEGGDRSAEGERLSRWAATRGEEPYRAAVGLLTASGGDVGMVGFAMSEENTACLLAHRLGMVCSDGGAFALSGPARRGHPHPRGLGAFPRVLGHYVRETGVLSLAAAVRKMSAFPASRVRLAGRGQLAPGFAADVVAFDPGIVADRATFTEPFRYPAGIRHVLVNGGLAIRDGEHGRRRFGRALRPQR